MGRIRRSAEVAAGEIDALEDHVGAIREAVLGAMSDAIERSADDPDELVVSCSLDWPGGVRNLLRLFCGKLQIKDFLVFSLKRRSELGASLTETKEEKSEDE